MAATALTVTQLDHETAVTLPASPGVAADTTNGNSVANGGNTLLVVNNTAGSSATVDLVTPGTVDDLPVGDRQFTVPANTIQLVRVGPPSVYGTTVRINSSATTVKLAAYAF